MNYSFPVQTESWPQGSDGWNAIYDSAVDSMGNDVFWSIDDSTCNHWSMNLQQPNDTGDQPMYEIPGGGTGTLMLEMPVIPMEGLRMGRLEVLQPASVANSYTVNQPQWTNYTNIWGNAGAFNLVSPGALCDEGGEQCADTDFCAGKPLWQVEPFEAALQVGMDGSASPTEGCEPFVGFTPGNFAIVRRGSCNFTVKGDNAVGAGATGPIIVNSGVCSDPVPPNSDPDECAITMGGDPGTGFFLDIPYVMMGRRQGEALIAAVEANEDVRLKVGNFADTHMDFYSWAQSDDTDPDIENDLVVTRIPLGEMGPTFYESYIAAAAAAAGAEGAFFQTDVDINNKGMTDATVYFEWLPRGADNSMPAASEPFTLAAGTSMFFPNILVDEFGLTPDVVGAIRMVDDTGNVIGMSRTYNVPGEKVAGTFGQALPAVPSDMMLMGTATNRIIFQSENDDIRANVGCQNGTAEGLRVSIDLYDNEGMMLETKTLDLQPYSNGQINRIFRAYSPVDGYVDVYTASDTASYYCYGSVLDNETSDPTSILPLDPSDMNIFVPAAALAGGAQGSFFQTDVDINNTGSADATYTMTWLPRGADNSGAEPTETFVLSAGNGVRYANVASEVFGLEADVVGAFSINASTPDLLAMSRTYNIPQAKLAGTFGQSIAGVPMDQMMMSGEMKRIVFMAENDEFRANVGCQNGSTESVRVNVDLYDADGMALETKFIDLQPLSNGQISRVFRAYAPVLGYVDVSHNTEGAYVTCYGSVLDNLTSDPTTVAPQ
jgi:hypothetical protein